MIFLNQGGTSFEAKPLPNEAQKSSIEDFSFNATTGTLAFVGNNNNNVAELGPSLANAGGLFNFYDSTIQNFASYQRFPLPLGTIAKKIVQLDNDDFVVITNNDNSYLLKKKE
jgi:hypothetical protein